MTSTSARVNTLRALGLHPLGDAPVDPLRPVATGGHVRAFHEIVTAVNARTVIEVGSWEGRSAVLWGRELAARGHDWLLICVDTWLGSVEMWERESGEWSREGLALSDGYPTVFSTFASNVRGAGLAEHTVAFPIDSSQGLELLKRHGVFADIIYVDAAHDFTNALRDIRRAHNLVDPENPHSLVLCDDYMTTWPGVREAIHVSARETSSRVFAKDAQAALVPQAAHDLADALASHGWSESVVDAPRDSGTDAQLELAIAHDDANVAIERLTRELRDTHEMVHAVRSKLTSARQQVRQAKASRRALRTRIRALRTSSTNATRQFQLAREEAALLDERLVAIQQSRSWLLTAWLRKLNEGFQARRR